LGRITHEGIRVTILDVVLNQSRDCGAMAGCRERWGCTESFS